MNTKIIIPAGKLIAVAFCLTLASPAFGLDLDQNQKTEEIRKCTPKITEEETLLQAIDRAGGFSRLARKQRTPLKLDERPVPPRFPANGSTILAPSVDDQPNSANKTRERTA